MMSFPPQLNTIIEAQPFPLLFVTVSGAHLYGFASPDSDFDLRGAHILPLREVVGLSKPTETIDHTSLEEKLEIDLVTHDIHKYFTMLLKRNGYVLEQILSPLVLHTTPAHNMLKELCPACLTKHHAHHYLGFAQTQWRLFEKEHPHRVKPLLYVFRVLLTGIHLMQSGELEANLPRLNTSFRLSYLDDLIARKTAGEEHGTLPETDLAFFQTEYQRLLTVLEQARDTSQLPEAPSAQPALNHLLIELRLGQLSTL